MFLTAWIDWCGARDEEAVQRERDRLLRLALGDEDLPPRSLTDSQVVLVALLTMVVGFLLGLVAHG